MLKIDFENQILALFDVYFWPFNKSHEKINIIFVISAIIASIWNVFIKFRWQDEKLTLIWDKMNYNKVKSFNFTSPSVLQIETVAIDIIGIKVYLLF